MAGVLLIGAPTTGGSAAGALLGSELDGSSEHELAGIDAQIESVSQFGEDLAKLYAISRSTTLVVIVVGGLLGVLVIGVGHGKRHAGEELGTGSSAGPALDSG